MIRLNTKWKKVILGSLIASLSAGTIACNSATEEVAAPAKETTIAAVSEAEVTEATVLSTPTEAAAEETEAPQIIAVITNKSAEESEDPFTFVGAGITMKPGDEAAPILTSLGTADSVYEAPSCVFVGNDVVYVYDGFEVNTAKKDGKEIIVGCFVTDERATTPAGITVGSSLAEVKEAYGEPDEDATGQMIWHSAEADLTIVVIEDAVTSISYIGNFGQ